MTYHIKGALIAFTFVINGAFAVRESRPPKASRRAHRGRQASLATFRLSGTGFIHQLPSLRGRIGADYVTRPRKICRSAKKRNILAEDPDDLCEDNFQFFQQPPSKPSVNKLGETEPDESAADPGQEVVHLLKPAKYISTNTWPRSRRGRDLKKRAARPYVRSVEIQRLEGPHPLAGQQGLFAARPFEQFDIVGEYCGEVYEADDGSEYATYLEDVRDVLRKYALGVDATKEGNECRFINHYTGIGESPNVVMKIAYVEELPRVMIVCTRDIAKGEEFLLKYSDEYVDEYF